MVALGGVVVDHVKDDFEAGGMKGPHHRLELVHLAAACPARAVPAVRGQEGNAVVPPVVAQPAFEEMGVLDELVHRQQLHRRDAEIGQVARHCRLSQACIGAPQLLGYVRVAPREALYMGLVDDGLVQRCSRAVSRRPSRSADR